MKKILAFILTVCLIATLVPFTASTATENTEGYYTYTVTDGKAEITAVSKAISGDVTIPSTLGGYPVTSIGRQAFLGCSQMTNVTIPNSVTSIGFCAFSSCYGLLSVNIPDSVTSIGSYSFEYGKNLESVTIGKGLATIGSCAFIGCEKLTSVTIGSGVTSISGGAFQNCTSLKSITIPKNVTMIGANAFSGCTSLAKVYFANAEIWKADTTVLSGLSSSSTAAKYLTQTYATVAWAWDKEATPVTIPEYTFDPETEVGILSVKLINPAWLEVTFSEPVVKSANVFAAIRYVSLETGVPQLIWKDVDGDGYNDPLQFNSDSSKFLDGKMYVRIGDNDYAVSNDIFDKLSGTAFGDNVSGHVVLFCIEGLPVIEGGALVEGMNEVGYIDAITSIDGTKKLKASAGKAHAAGTYDEVDFAIDNPYADGDFSNVVHYYDNDCDATCNVCGEEREVSGHVYDNACDTTCNICGYVRTISHTYDNSCDTTCNTCGYVREITHNYSSKWTIDSENHWHECIVCGDKTDIDEHNYSDEWSNNSKEHWHECTVCGDKTDIEQHFIENRICTVCNKEFIIATMSSATANRGDKVTLTVTLAGAPKTNTMAFELKDLPEGITFVEDGSSWEKDSYIDDFNVEHGQGIWMINTDEIDPNGLVLSLAFEIGETVSCGEYIINFEFYPSGSLNTDDATTEIAGVITVHIFSDEWLFDELGHWHECETCDEASDVIEHIYDNACDTTCNTCGYVREITHNYSSKWTNDSENHWHECIVCGDKTEVAEHIYDNACDTTCNVCEDVREITHDYEWVVDEEENCGVDGKKHEECTVCHTTRNENTVIPATGNHTYDNACDTMCNVCEHVREITHDYSEDWTNDGENHWHECIVCGDKTEVAEHIYDNACDTTCNTCGYVREITHDYSEEWTTTGANHWRECTVCGDKTDVDTHIYDDELKHDESNHWYECTVCAKKNIVMEHSYSGNWTSDSENHWHECESCGYKTVINAHKFDNACDTTCNTCGYVREITHDYSEEWTNDSENHWRECTVCGDKTDVAEHTAVDGVCTVCGADCYVPGDVDGEEGITANDAIYLLYNVFFGDEAYPVDQPCDFDGDGGVTANDAIYLLYHVFFGDESYPLN